MGKLIVPIVKSAVSETQVMNILNKLTEAVQRPGRAENSQTEQKTGPDAASAADGGEESSQSDKRRGNGNDLCHKLYFLSDFPKGVELLKQAENRPFLLSARGQTVSD